MYNMDNNVRGCPCGKKEEAIPMARKWLSGALAFAMIFGCSAPVALAEETPVEVVEQESLEEVEQYALYNPHFAKDTYEVTNTAKSKVVLKMEQAPNVEPKSVKLDGYDMPTANFTGAWNSNKTEYTITLLNNVEAGKTYTVTVEYAETAGDVFNTTTATTQIKTVAAEDTSVTASLADGKTVEVAAGEKTEFTFKVGNGKAPAVVNLKPMTAAAEYVSFAKEDLTEDGKVVGTKVVATGLKETPADANLDIKVEVKATDSSETKTYTYNIKVTEATTTDAVVSVTAKADKTNITTADTATIIAQATKYDAYGDITDYDNAKLNWSVNGQTLDFKGGTTATIKDVLGKAYITVTKTSGVDGIINVEITKAGTYTFVVSPADNPYMTYPVTVTVKEADTAQSVTLDGDATKPVALGGSINLNDLKWVVNGDKTLADFGVTMEYTIKGSNVSDTKIAGTSNDQAKAIAAITDGVLSVADLNDELLSALFAQSKDYEIVQFKVDAQGKVGDTKIGSAIELTINITKAQKEAAKYVVYVDGKELKDLTQFPALTVGVPTTLKIEVQDEYGFADAVAQDVVFDTHAQGDLDPSTYVSYVQTAANEIVITPLVSSIDKVFVKWTVASKTELNGEKALVIKANTNPTPTATPEPSTTPEPSPTTEPSPTAAPVVRTGVVVNVSSNLNIRAAANTSSTVVTKVKNGTNLVILGEEGNFYKVQLADGKIGYASKDYVRETTDTPVQPTGDYAIVTTKGGRLNMRQTAGGAVITSIANGTRVDVISEGSEWTLIEYNGRQGYVSTAYLTIYHGAVG